MSPAATVLYTVGHLRRRATAASATATRWCRPTRPASTVHDDWDALGMRASGSNSVTLRRRRAPRSRPARRLPPPATPTAVHGAQPRSPACSTPRRRSASPRRRRTQSLRRGSRGRRTTRARAHAGRRERRRPRRPRAACSPAAARRPASTNPPPTAASRAALFAEAQAAKTFVNEAAARIVDRALALSGGAGYRNGHPLARAYRDVRAGAFMHPLGANRAYDFLGHVALGADPAIH